MQIQLCPTAASLAAAQRRRRALRRRSFPRLYAMHLATRAIFEVSRQRPDCHPGAVARFACDFGPAWRVWPEYCPQPHDCDAHLRPAA